MWPLRQRGTNPFDLRPEPPVGELPPGYRLRRVGPCEWVAEPSRWYVWTAVIVVLAFCAGGIAGALAARTYYHRSATVLLMTVNGTPLRRDELRNRLERRYGITEVERFALVELSRQFAEARDCWPDDAEVSRRFEEERRKPNFMEKLAIMGMTEEMFREELRLDMAQTKLLTRGVTVSPQEVLAFYRRNADPANPAARYYTPERVQVTAIGTGSEEAARQCLRELLAGVPWKEAVARYSEDASRRTGGLLPPFARGESVFATNAATEAAIFAMKPGDRIGPVEAGRQWWLLRCENKWLQSVIPWHEAKEDATIGAMLVKGIERNRSRLAAEQQAFVRRSRIIIADEAYGGAQEVVLSRPVRW